MAIIGLFQCDPWCLPTQKWLKNATNDISIQEFHNIITHYKQSGCLASLYKIASKGLNVEILQILFLKTTCSCVYFSKYVCCHAAKWL